MTKQAVAKLIAETSHSLTVDDLDLVEQLDEIAKGLSGVSRTERRILNQPFDLCGILFYPLTVAKSVWYAEKVDEWELSGVQQEGLLFWMLSLPNDSEVLDANSCPKKANKAARRLSKRLHCTPDEITAVYDKCVGAKGSKESSDSGGAADHGGMIASLLREYGGTVDQWLYETPIETISDLFRAQADRAFHEEEGQRRSAAKNGKAIAPPPSKRLESLAKFRKKTNEIKDIWNGE